MKKFLFVALAVFIGANVALAKDGGNGLRPQAGDACVAKDGGNGVLVPKDGGNGLKCKPAKPYIFDPNGSWPNSRELLLILKDKLKDLVSYMNEEVLENIIKNTPPEGAKKPFVQGMPKLRPDQVTRNVLADIVDRVEYPSYERLDKMAKGIVPTDGARPFYYDLARMRIKAQFAYFWNYGRGDVRSVTDGEKRAIQEFMLREASHLWGFGDEQGKYFARTLADALRISPYNGQTGMVKLNNVAFSGGDECYYLATSFNQMSTPTMKFNSVCKETDKTWNGRGVWIVTTTLKINGCDDDGGQEAIIRSGGAYYENKAVIYGNYPTTESRVNGDFIKYWLDRMLPENQKATASLNGQIDFEKPFMQDSYYKGVRARLGGNFCKLSWEDGK